jgi:hypothetical protein
MLGLQQISGGSQPAERCAVQRLCQFWGCVQFIRAEAETMPAPDSCQQLHCPARIVKKKPPLMSGPATAYFREFAEPHRGVQRP